MLGMTSFVLQFAASEIDGLAARYGYAHDDEALKAGSNIVGGNYSRENLKIIVHWIIAKISLADWGQVSAW
jgi:hypothetical protein